MFTIISATKVERSRSWRQTLAGIGYSITFHGWLVFFDGKYYRVKEKVLGARFPLIASHSRMPRADLRAQLASSVRAKVLLVAAIGFSLFAATADLLIKILYDERYQAAGRMLPVLIIGSWLSILATIDESTLLGLGKPSYGAISNGRKLVRLWRCHLALDKPARLGWFTPIIYSIRKLTPVPPPPFPRNAWRLP